MATSIEDLIKSSICFGVAYDGSVKECKICEVRLKCKSKCEMGTGELPKKPEATTVADTSEVTLKDDAPAAPKAEKKPAKAVKKDKPTVNYADDMPDLKAMEFDALCTLATERGVDLADFEKYSNESIKRMRLTMAIKKTFEV